jgi:hypothetical protein
MGTFSPKEDMIWPEVGRSSSYVRRLEHGHMRHSLACENGTVCKKA